MTFMLFDVKITRWIETFSLFISARDFLTLDRKGLSNNIEDYWTKVFSPRVASVKKQKVFCDLPKRLDDTATQ